MNRIIVSRHPAAIEFIREQVAEEYCHYTDNETIVSGDVRNVDGELQILGPAADGAECGPIIERIPIIAQAAIDDVWDRDVIGNIPLSLASCAARVKAIEFAGNPPRGQEYTLEDMKKAGAVLVPYVVVQTDESRQELFSRIHTGV